MSEEPNGKGNGRRKRGRPPKSAPPLDIDYGLIAALAKVQCTEYEIASALNMAPDVFSRCKKKDPRIQETLDKNYAGGKISLRRSQYRAALDRHLTICKDCGKIHADNFLPSCPYCDDQEPELAGQHTNVDHKFVPGNITMMIWLGKIMLQQREVVTLSGDAERPFVFSTLAEFVLNRAKKNGANAKQHGAESKEAKAQPHPQEA